MKYTDTCMNCGKEFETDAESTIDYFHLCPDCWKEEKWQYDYDMVCEAQIERGILSIS